MCVCAYVQIFSVKSKVGLSSLGYIAFELNIREMHKKRRWRHVVLDQKGSLGQKLAGWIKFRQEGPESVVCCLSAELNYFSTSLKQLSRGTGSENISITH